MSNVVYSDHALSYTKLVHRHALLPALVVRCEPQFATANYFLTLNATLKTQLKYMMNFTFCILAIHTLGKQK